MVKQVGSKEGDKIIEEYENDIEIQDIIKQLKDLEADEEGFKLGNQSKKMAQIL